MTDREFNFGAGGLLLGILLAALIILIVASSDVQVPNALTQVQRSPSNPAIRYVPVVVEGENIIVDCDHPKVLCDDEGA